MRLDVRRYVYSHSIWPRYCVELLPEAADNALDVEAKHKRNGNQIAELVAVLGDMFKSPAKATELIGQLLDQATHSINQ